MLLSTIQISSCKTPLPPQTGIALGTICTINLFDYGTPLLYKTMFDKLASLEQMMSTNIETSDLMLINKYAGINAVAVNEETIFVLERSLYFAEISGGAFDPTIGPLVNLWGISKQDPLNPKIPLQEDIEKCLELLGWAEVQVDKNAKTVFLPRAGMALDLGGIAKGYPADALVKILKDANVKRALLDLGGNIYALGEKKSAPLGLHKSAWKIGIQEPGAAHGEYSKVVQAANQAVVTSGIYERYFMFDGKRYHHILSSTTGKPAESGLQSVTVIYENSIDADALSTAIFVLGKQKGDELAAKFPGIKVLYTE